LVLNSGDRDSAVNLGAFDEFIHRRNRETKLSFNFEWQLQKNISVSDPKTDKKWEADAISFDGSIGLLGDKQPQPRVEHFSYQLRLEGSPILEVGLKAAATETYKLSAKPYKLVRMPGRKWQLGAPIRFYGFPDQVAAYYQNADFVQDLSLSLETMLRSICYLGPLRSRGERLYQWSGGQPANVGYSGKDTISAMLAAKERKLNTGYKKWNRSFMELVAEQLQQLGLIESFEVRQISANRREYEVKIKTPGAMESVDLPDVGFGVSQVLPVIVQCFYAPPGSILFIEQPELHLHPSAQSNLADLFIDVLASRQSGFPRNVQLIIETHSEHFLNRLQRRIAENDPLKPITPAQVACYFAKTTGSESSLEQLRMDRFGNIENWPENFFGDSMGDLLAMQRAAASRRMSEAQS